MKRLSAKHYALALHALLEKGSAKQRPALVRGFLRVLQKRRQIRLLPQVVESIERLRLQKQGKALVQTRSRQPLSPAATAALKKRFGAKLVLESSVDLALKGGVSVRVEDELFDASLDAVLQQLHQRLTNV